MSRGADFVAALRAAIASPHFAARAAMPAFDRHPSETAERASPERTRPAASIGSSMRSERNDEQYQSCMLPCCLRPRALSQTVK